MFFFSAEDAEKPQTKHEKHDEDQQRNGGAKKRTTEPPPQHNKKIKKKKNKKMRGATAASSSTTTLALQLVAPTWEQVKRVEDAVLDDARVLQWFRFIAERHRV